MGLREASEKLPFHSSVKEITYPGGKGKGTQRPIVCVSDETVASFKKAPATPFYICYSVHIRLPNGATLGGAREALKQDMHSCNLEHLIHLVDKPCLVVQDERGVRFLCHPEDVRYEEPTDTNHEPVH